MSTGLECLFVERKPGEWFYILENWNAPKNSWDWREHSRAYGPFKSEDEAMRHLDDNHANPGGHSTVPHAQFREDAVYKNLFKEAEERGKGGTLDIPSIWFR